MSFILINTKENKIYYDIEDFNGLLSKADGSPGTILESFVNNHIMPKENSGLKKIIWPDDLIYSKTGNCVDISLFVHYYLNHFNVEHYLVNVAYASVIKLGQSLLGHTFIIFRDGFHFWIFNYTSDLIADIHGPFGTLKETCETATKYYLALFRSLRLLYSYNDNSNPINDYLVGNYVYWNQNELSVIDDIINDPEPNFTQTNLFQALPGDKLNTLKNLVMEECIKHRAEVLDKNNIPKPPSSLTNVNIKIKYPSIININKKYIKEAQTLMKLFRQNDRIRKVK